MPEFKCVTTYFDDICIASDSKEQQFAMKRQLFLTEQGYRYFIEDFAAQ